MCPRCRPVRRSRGPVSVEYPTWLPISKPSRSAVALSITSSSGPLDARPLFSSIPARVSGWYCVPNIGPVTTIGSPSPSRICALAVMSGSTTATPSRPRTRSATSMGIGGASWSPPKLSSSKALTPRTWRSTSCTRSSISPSKDRVRLSASTKEPETNDTPATTANTIAMVRPRRARMLLRAMSEVEPDVLPVFLVATGQLPIWSMRSRI